MTIPLMFCDGHHFMTSACGHHSWFM